MRLQPAARSALLLCRAASSICTGSQQAWQSCGAAATAASAAAHQQQLDARQQAARWQCSRQLAAFSSSSRPWSSQWRHQSTTITLSETPTQQILDAVTAARLNDELQDEAASRAFMPYEELVQFIIEHGCARNVAEAQERAAALSKAGVVLQFNGMVYLRPQEVTELVYKLLPADPRTAQQTLSVLESELGRMDKQHRQICSRAQRWPRRWLYAGCAALATQLVGFSYLTWWELSWDVMEPIAYMLSLSYSLLAYIYFLATRGSYMDQKEFKEYWEQQQLEKVMAAAGFDLDKYQHLRRTRDRYRRYLASAGSLSEEAQAVLDAVQDGGSGGDFPGSDAAGAAAGQYADGAGPADASSSAAGKLKAS